MDYDQDDVTKAIKYLDEMNETSVFETYKKKWEQHVSSKENLSAKISTDFFKERIGIIKKLQKNK